MTSSRITIEFADQLESATYARVVHVLWGVLSAGGYASVATIHTDGTATDRELEAELETLVEMVIKSNPFGW